MPTYPLPYRIHDFLARQIAWSHAVLAELDQFCVLPDFEDVDAAAELQQRRERETRDMAREYSGLLDEWSRAKAIDPDVRKDIVRHSLEAQALVEQVKQRYHDADRVANMKKAQTRQTLNDLRRGRRSVNIYRPGVLVSPGFIDREV